VGTPFHLRSRPTTSPITPLEAKHPFRKFVPGTSLAARTHSHKIDGVLNETMPKLQDILKVPQQVTFLVGISPPKLRHDAFGVSQISPTPENWMQLSRLRNGVGCFKPVVLNLFCPIDHLFKKSQWTTSLC